MEFEGGDFSSTLMYDIDRKSMTANNGVILRICIGTNAVTVAADEVIDTKRRGRLVCRRDKAIREAHSSQVGWRQCR